MADRYTGQGVGPPIPREWNYARSAEEREARRRERHKRWIASLSDRDWDRLAAMADSVLAGQRFARVADLDAPIYVGVIDPEEKHPPNGERFGKLRGAVLMGWDQE